LNDTKKESKKRTGFNPMGQQILPQIRDLSGADNASNIASNPASNIASNPASKITSKPAKVKATFYIMPDQLKALTRLSKKTGRDKSELIRMAIDGLLDNI
jgi:hypothetical protein